MGHVERGTCLQGAPTKDDDMWFGPKTQGTARSALDSESNKAKFSDLHKRYNFVEVGQF